MISWILKRLRSAEPRDERGAVLVITAIAMVAVLAAAAYAIDTAIWYVHARHLQTQADAGAFAGARAMADGIENGNCSDSAVKNVVAQYDGSGQSTPSTQSQYNAQVPKSPTYAGTYSPTAHNLFANINTSNFQNQSIPNDTGLTGNTCHDSTVDVKLTETNLPSFLTLVKASYINKQAQVRAETVRSGSASPFVLPNILTPSDVAAFVVGENAMTPAFSTDTILARLASCVDNGNVPPCLTSSNNGATWTATGLSVPFGSTPAALVVVRSTSAIAPSALNGVTSGATLVTFCSSSGVNCYDQSDGAGLTYTRTYPASSPSNFPSSGPPTIGATSVADSTLTTACESAGSSALYTGFMTSSTSCNVSVNANLNFGTSANSSCNALTSSSGNNLGATLTVTAYQGTTTTQVGSPITLSCPNPGSTTAGSANGIWTSSSTIAIPATTGTTGPVTFDLTWSRTGGGSAVPRASWESGGFTSGGPSGQCGSGTHACTADFQIIQRIFTGAYDQNTANTPSPSGAVAGAALTSASGELMATPTNTPVPGLGVTIDFQDLSNTAAASGGHVPSGSFTDIAYGTNQADGLVDCGQGGNAGGGSGPDPQLQAISGAFVCNSYPAIPSLQTCSTYTPSTNDCPFSVPGESKFTPWLDGGLAYRIYGSSLCGPLTSINKFANACGNNPMSAAKCQTAPNYWNTANLMSALEDNASDPRLLTVLITDPGPLPNGYQAIPVRHYATFYVTGWSGDPCSGVTLNGQNANGLRYTSDDVAPAGFHQGNNEAAFVVGHFIKDFQPGATGSGSSCVPSSIDNCTLTVTK